MFPKKTRSYYHNQYGLKKIGRIDIFINNAGITIDAPLLKKNCFPISQTINYMLSRHSAVFFERSSNFF